jgi:hypothetical protein
MEISSSSVDTGLDDQIPSLNPVESRDLSLLHSLPHRLWLPPNLLFYGSRGWGEFSTEN